MKKKEEWMGTYHYQMRKIQRETRCLVFWVVATILATVFIVATMSGVWHG